MTHGFKKTTRKVKGKTVWRCNNCDSECVFDENTSEGDVNRFITAAYPKLICVKAN